MYIYICICIYIYIRIAIYIYLYITNQKHTEQSLPQCSVGHKPELKWSPT